MIAVDTCCRLSEQQQLAEVMSRTRPLAVDVRLQRSVDSTYWGLDCSTAVDTGHIAVVEVCETLQK